MSYCNLLHLQESSQAKLLQCCCNAIAIFLQCHCKNSLHLFRNRSSCHELDVYMESFFLLRNTKRHFQTENALLFSLFICRFLYFFFLLDVLNLHSNTIGSTVLPDIGFASKDYKDSLTF